jgi:hypothetical protein
MQPEAFEGREAPHGPDLGIGGRLRNGGAGRDRLLAAPERATDVALREYSIGAA